MTNQTEREGKKPSLFVKILKGLGLCVLVAGAAVAAYDHRNQIISVAKKAGNGVKSAASKVADKIKS